MIKHQEYVSAPGSYEEVETSLDEIRETFERGNLTRELAEALNDATAQLEQYSSLLSEFRDLVQPTIESHNNFTTEWDMKAIELCSHPLLTKDSAVKDAIKETIKHVDEMTPEQVEDLLDSAELGPLGYALSTEDDATAVVVDPVRQAIADCSLTTDDRGVKK